MKFYVIYLYHILSLLQFVYPFPRFFLRFLCLKLNVISVLQTFSVDKYGQDWHRMWEMVWCGEGCEGPSRNSTDNWDFVDNLFILWLLHANWLLRCGLSKCDCFLLRAKFYISFQNMKTHLFTL